MKRYLGYAAIIATLLSLFVSLAAAQEPKPEAKSTAPAEWNFYKLDFVVRELDDGKTVNTRNYTMMARSNDWQQLRVGTRVPVQRGDKDLQYMDVGLQVDCRIMEGRDENAALLTKAEITSFAAGETGPGGAPIVRHVQMNTTAPLTLGKMLVISGVDELSSKHRFQLEVTVTRAK